METNVSKTLMDRWRRQVGGRLARGTEWVPRPMAALGYLVNGRPAKDYVEVDRLLMVIVYDDPVGPDMVALRVAGYRASCVSHGVQFGGRENARFHKDLCLAPGKPDGLRIGIHRTELLGLALQLEREIHQVAEFGRRLRQSRPWIPRLWASFGLTDAANICASGPEFEAMRAKYGYDAQWLFRKFERRYKGTVLYPLDWVSDALHQSLGIYAELKGFPKRQVFSVRKLPDDLCGFRGAAEWDFFDSELRDRWNVRALAAKPSATEVLCEA